MLNSRSNKNKEEGLFDFKNKAYDEIKFMRSDQITISYDIYLKGSLKATKKKLDNISKIEGDWLKIRYNEESVVLKPIDCSYEKNMMKLSVEMNFRLSGLTLREASRDVTKTISYSINLLRNYIGVYLPQRVDMEYRFFNKDVDYLCEEFKSKMDKMGYDGSIHTSKNCYLNGDVDFNTVLEIGNEKDNKQWKYRIYTQTHDITKIIEIVPKMFDKVLLFEIEDKPNMM